MISQNISSFTAIDDELKLPFFIHSVGKFHPQLRLSMSQDFPYHQIYYCSKGVGVLKINGEAYEITEGEGFFIKSQLPYELFPYTNNWITHHVSFGGFASDQLINELKFLDYSIFHNLNIGLLEIVLTKMNLLTLENDLYNKCHASAMVYNYIMEVYSQKENLTNKDSIDCTNHAFLLAKQFVENNYFADLSLDVISNYANITPQYLCRLFQKYLSMRPSHYIATVRMSAAKHLLSYTNKTIFTISEEVGFNNPHYFTTTFKKLENMAPSQYRALTHKSNNYS